LCRGGLFVKKKGLPGSQKYLKGQKLLLNRWTPSRQLNLRLSVAASILKEEGKVNIITFPPKLYLKNALRNKLILKRHIKTTYF